mmetsp:Transcript_31900/g.68890  ORF Transcript_31900/g.68890 Transcript_31900/m.68890 type:complete len:409 (+) Transcript_31900:486-1712(+)
MQNHLVLCLHQLSMCWGLTADTLPSLPNRILAKQSSLSHPSLYDDALPEAKFFCLLSKLLRICGYYEFGFKDLASPQPKRFRRQLSAVINFLKYREDMGHLEAQALEEREEQFAALDEVAENHMALKDHMEEAKAINHEKMLEREEAEAECKEMEAEIAQQNKIQSSIRQETYLLKKSANELKDQIANLSIALREIQAKERQLSKEVVHSPDRIKVDLATAIQKLEGLKDTISKTQRERTLVRKRMEHVASAQENVKEITTAMEEMETRVQEYEIVVEDCDDAQNRLAEIEHELEEKKGEREEQECRLRAVEKQRSDTEMALNSALRNAQNELDSAVSRLGIVESERLDGIARIEATEKRVAELKSDIEHDRKETEEEIAKRIASFQKWEKSYYAKEEPLNLQLGYLG